MPVGVRVVYARVLFHFHVVVTEQTNLVLGKQSVFDGMKKSRISFIFSQGKVQFSIK